MKWITSSAKSERGSTVFNYIDDKRNIQGSVTVLGKKIKWFVGASSGSAKSIGHGKRIIERSVKK